MNDRPPPHPAEQVAGPLAESRDHQTETTARREAAIEARERAARERERAIDFREQMAHEREASVLDREAQSDARDARGGSRDILADQRDSLAFDRDEAARVRDDSARRHTLDEGPPLRAMRMVVTDQLAHAASDRSEAAADRRWAADDREASRDDRDASSDDRRSSSRERASDNLDDLTGALRRGVGLVELARCIAAAQAGGDDLVLGFVDVVGLKAVNDLQGHQSGDAVLVDVVVALRAHIRAVDAIVRLGGDEFLVILGGADLTVASGRLMHVHEMLADTTLAPSVTIGLAQMQHDDTGESLMARADADLYHQRDLATQSQHRPPAS